MELYERLIGVIDAFIATFDGAMRLQGIQTLLLVQKASRFGHGISPSTAHRLTGAPQENIRRRFLAFEERGLLESRADPKDDRSTLFTMTATGFRTWPAEDVARRLHLLRPEGQPAHPPFPLGAETFDALIAVLEAFKVALDGSVRIRGFKTALLIQQATLSGRGITATTLSRHTGAALETVRRHMAKHTAFGDLKMVEDPEDERAVRVLTADPDREGRTFAAVALRLNRIDWNLFNLP